LQLALAPLPNGYALLNTANTQNVNHGSALYAGETSLPLTPENYSALTVNPALVLGPATPSVNQTNEPLTIRFLPGATVSCSLMDESGNPVTPSTSENMFVIVPVTDATGPMPPLPSGLAELGLQRGILTGATTTQGGSSGCSAAGIAATPAGGAIIESNTVVLNGEEKVFVTSVGVSATDAESGSTVEALMIAEPRRALTHYVVDPLDDGGRRGEIGLVTGGWTFDGETATDQFVVAARFRGKDQYTLQISFSDDTGAHTYQIVAHCVTGECKYTPNGSKLPDGLLESVSGAVRKSDDSGMVLWRLNLPGVTDVDVVVYSKSDVAPDGERPAGMHKKGNGNTWVIAG
jgi:hypothetical protein